jgi:hypothetical protein
MALAARIGDYLIQQNSHVLNHHDRSMDPGPIRRDLSPPDTWGHGMPRM